MKSRVIASLLITMGLLIFFSGEAGAQSPDIQVHLDIEPVTSPPELLEATPTLTSTPTAITKLGTGTSDEGISTFFWALAVILGASILWLIGELLGPTKKDKESQDT